ncbi:MAG: ATP-binding protein [Verrucomicrobiales bacterium]
MIRLKLFIGLFSAVVVLALAGAFGMGLVKSGIADFERIFAREYSAISSLHRIRGEIQSLNVHYLPLFTLGDDFDGIGLERLEEGRERMARLADSVEKDLKGEVVVGDELPALRSAIDVYANQVATVVREGDAGMLPASRLEILGFSQRLFGLTENLIALLEADLAARRAALQRSSTQTIIFLSLATGIAILVAMLAYDYLSRGILGPVNQLTDSIREIQKRNLDLSLPVRTRDELGDLSDAFNVMAAELRVFSLESDEKVRLADAENRAIIGNFPHPIVFLNNEGEILKLNPKAETLFGKLTLDGGLPKRVRSLFNKALAEKKDYVPQELFNSVLLRVDEREYFYLPRIFRIYEHGKFDGWAIVLTDVTKLRWIDDIKNNFLSTVSHEIRTPLTSVRMVLHLLVEEKAGTLDDRQREMVTSARDETDRLVETISQLVSTSRIESADEYLVTKEILPGQLIENALKTCVAIHDGNTYRIEVSCEDDMPTVEVDEAGIALVFQNYLSNAIRHSPVDAPIEIRAQRIREEFVRFSVIDRGEGVPEELEEAVFEKFVRTGGASGEGVGLGLSISRDIVHAHGGRVGLKSEGGTTEFYFDLPTA